MNPNTLKQQKRKVKCASDAFRNWPQGHGSYRISGNFGPLIPYIKDARENGFDDVLWLIDDYIKELTILNFFVLWKNRAGEVELLTPSDDGCLFNGVPR